MNTFEPPIDPLEERLRQVAPTPPSAALLARLTTTRPATVVHRRTVWWWRVAVPLAAAAAIVMVVRMVWIAPHKTVGPVVFEDRFRPVEREEYVFGGRELGIYHAPDGRAYRLVETLGVNRQVWENVADRTRVEHAFPEQRLALVSMKTY